MKKSEAYTKNIRIINLLNEMSNYFRRQNFNRGDRLFRDWTGLFSELVTELIQDKDYYNAYGDIVDEVLLMEILSQILNAQENKDYVLLTDLLQMNLLPLLLSIQEIYKANNDISEVDYFDKNMEYIKATNSSSDIDAIKKRYDLINSCESIFKDPKTYKEYILKSASTGDVILEVVNGNGSINFHSNNDPDKEGLEIAEYYYDSYKREYIVFGLGMGYHVRQLCRITNGKVKIKVYENDINVLALSLVMMDFTGYLSGNLEIYYDKEFSAFIKDIGDNTGFDMKTRTLLMYYPAVRNIVNDAARDKFEKLFVQDSSVRNQLGDMLSNFYKNIELCTEPVDVIGEKIKGKHVILAGAGPSLDHYFDDFKNMEPDSVLMVVGTAFRKFVKAGLIPDYVVFLDASERIFGQLRGLEEVKTELIVASTACAKIPEHFCGKKYIVFQNGMDEAEDYAKAHGLKLYESGGSVSTIAFDICVKLGAKKISLYGMDLSYPNGEVHAKDANYRKLNDTAGLIKVKCADGGTVYTTTAMDMYRLWFEERIKSINKSGQQVEIINYTHGGAYIDGICNHKG